MKKAAFLLTLLVMTTLILAQKTMNDPNAVVREASGYHSIQISHAFDVYLIQGNEEAVAVSANEQKYRDLIKVEVKNGVLIIGLEKSRMSWRGNKALKAYISFKKLDNLQVSGACDVYLQGTISSDDLQISMSGASDLKGMVNAKKLKIDLSGASDITLSGVARQMDIEASGASAFKGLDLATDYCNARASGASDIRITVNKEISASASGASDVKYKGEAVTRDIKTSGASSFSRI